MNVYIFGNIDENQDNKPLIFLPQLKNDFSKINFVEVKPNQDLDIEETGMLYIVDTVSGIKECKIIKENEFEKIMQLQRTTVHDYDLGFQLKYLRKLGKIDKVSILGIPQETELDYNTFQSIFKKFVAQDIQGS